MYNGDFGLIVHITLSDFITEQKKMAEEKQTKVDVIQEEEFNGVIEVLVPEQITPEK